MKTYTVKIDNVGTVRWYDEKGEYHRENGPAIEYENGDVEYYFNGLLHRIDGPAIELANGIKFWFMNGRIVTEADVMRLNETIDIEGTKYTLAQIKAALKSVKS